MELSWKGNKDIIKKRGKGITILREFIVGKAETAKMLNAHSDK